MRNRTNIDHFFFNIFNFLQNFKTFLKKIKYFNYYSYLHKKFLLSVFLKLDFLKSDKKKLLNF